MASGTEIRLQPMVFDITKTVLGKVCEEGKNITDLVKRLQPKDNELENQLKDLVKLLKQDKQGEKNILNGNLGGKSDDALKSLPSEFNFIRSGKKRSHQAVYE